MDPYSHPTDNNIQIYPVNGPERKEYLTIDFYNKEPSNLAEEKEENKH